MREEKHKNSLYKVQNTSRIFDIISIKNISHAAKISRRGIEFSLASLKHVTVAVELWKTQHIKRSYSFISRFFFQYKLHSLL